MISIIMPAKNAALYLRDTLDSILNQTEQSWELLIVNDHSDDDTQQIIDRYCAIDSRIKSDINKGNGIIDALVTAYSKSQGQFITRMDADDLMHPQKLTLLQAQLQEQGRGYVATGMVKYFSEPTIGDGYQRYADWLNNLTIRNENFKDIYKECVIPSPCWMMHRDDLELIGGIASDSYPEDYDLCFRMYQFGFKIAGVKQVIHYWRDYPERTSRNDPNYSDNRFFDMKLHYFFKLTHQADKELLLLGAGKKAKAIAQFIVQQKVAFHWLTNNPKKIGHNIYGEILKPLESIADHSQAQIIIAISNPNDQQSIKHDLEQQGLTQGLDFFFFS